MKFFEASSYRTAPPEEIYIGTIFLDKQLQVQRVTPRVKEFLDVPDVKERLSTDDLTRLLGYNRLQADVELALEGVHFLEREIGGTGHVEYKVYVQPTLSPEDEPESAVLVLFSLTAQRQGGKEPETRVANHVRPFQESNDEFWRQRSGRQDVAQAVLKISEEARWRVGKSLHEKVGQALTGIRMMVNEHVRRLKEQGVEDVSDIETIGRLIRQVDSHLFRLASRLIPLQLNEGHSLQPALISLAERMEEQHNIRCPISIDEDVCCDDDERPLHLYRIVQEAVHDAAQHRHAQTVMICLSHDEFGFTVDVCDDGVGYSRKIRKEKSLGLRMDRQKATA